MNGREDKYQWAGPYLYSRQMVAVRKESEINTIQDLEGKRIAVQATTKAEDLFLHNIAFRSSANGAGKLLFYDE